MSLTAAPLVPCTALDLPAVLGASLAEIVAAHGPARSVAFYVTVNGEPVLRSGWSLVPAPGDQVQAVVLPRGGDDGKSVLGLVAMIALSAFAPWAGGVVAGLLKFSTTGLVAGLAGAAILAGGGILINTLLAPKAAAQVSSALEASPTYSASASGNQARLYGTIPVQYGEHIMVPDYVSDPYQEFEGNDQYLYLLFGRGLGKAAPKDVRIGETVVWTADDGYSGAIDDLEITFYDPGEQIDAFPVQVETSSEVGGQLLEQGSDSGPFTAVPAGQTAQRLGVDITLPEGLYRLTDSGGQTAASVVFQFSYREIDDQGAALGSWVVFADETLSLTTATPQRKSYSVSVPAGRYEVKAVRVNAWDDDDRIFDRLEWGGLRAYLDGPQSFADISTMAVKVKANEQLTSQSSQNFKLVQTRILEIWNGVAWVEQETRSIAWAAVDVARNSLYGAGYPASRIDLAAFMAYDALWDQRGDYFDGIFDTATTLFDAINTVLLAGRASVRFAGDQVSMVRDEPRSLPSQVFTDRNIVRGSLEVTYDLHQDSSADDVIIEYMDRDSWTTEEVRCTIAQSSSESPARVKMIGPTSREQAWREGIFLAADNYFRREKATFRTELEGRLVQRGDLIRVQSDLPQTWGHSGVVRGQSGLTVTLDREPETDPANTYIRFRQKDGGEWGPVKITWTDGASDVLLDSDDHDAVVASMGSLAGHLIDNGGEKPVYLLGEGVDFAFSGVVTGMVPEGKRVRLELVRENASVHLADDGLTVPDYPTGTLLPPSSGSPALVAVYASRDISVTESFLSISTPPVSGASSYEVEVSYDQASWTPAYSGRVPAASFAVRRDALWVRMRAVGTSAGPWTVVAIAAAPDEIRLPDGAVIETSATSLYSAVAGEVDADEILADLTRAADMARAVRDSLTGGGTGLNDVVAQLNLAGESALKAVLENEARRVEAEGLGAAITRVDTLVNEQRLAFAESIVLLSAEIAGNTAQILQVDQARADGESAFAASLAALTAQVNDDIAAAIVAEQTARTDGDSALASSLSSVSSTVNGHTASITSLSQAIDGIEARYVLSVEAAGVTGGLAINGIQQADGSGLINFNVIANRFVILDPSDTSESTQPFVFQNGTLYLSELVAVSITADDVRTGQIVSTDGTSMIIDLDAPYWVMQSS